MLQDLDICFFEFVFNQQKETISEDNPWIDLDLSGKLEKHAIAGAIISNKQIRVASDSNMKYILWNINGPVPNMHTVIKSCPNPAS